MNKIILEEPIDAVPPWTSVNLYRDGAVRHSLMMSDKVFRTEFPQYPNIAAVLVAVLGYDDVDEAAFFYPNGDIESVKLDGGRRRLLSNAVVNFLAFNTPRVAEDKGVKE